MPITSAAATLSASSDDDAAKQLFAQCRKNQWKRLLLMLRESPQLASVKMVMDNHIHTTILHQAITSKGDTADRAKVIKSILEQRPEAAQIKNGYGSLPLHVICQRNTKMRSSIKEELIRLLIEAYPEALVEPGGVGKRTPLHIAFTDYISPDLAQHMISLGKAACSLLDKKGWLPVHVACSRHASPEKLRMLLDAYPRGLWARTYDGETIHDLAKSTATKSHPNFCLIAELDAQIKNSTFKPEDLSMSGSKRPPMGSPNGTATIVSAGSSGDDEKTYPPSSKRRCMDDRSRGDPAELLLHLSRSLHEPAPATTAQRTYPEDTYRGSAYHPPYPASGSHQSPPVRDPYPSGAHSLPSVRDPYPSTGTHPPQSVPYHRQHGSVDQYHHQTHHESAPYHHQRAYQHASDHRYSAQSQHMREPTSYYHHEATTEHNRHYHHDAPTERRRHRQQAYQHRTPVYPAATLKHYYADQFDGEVAQV